MAFFSKARMFARVAAVSRFSSVRALPSLPSPSVVASKVGTAAAKGVGVLSLTGLGLATLSSVSSCDAVPAFTLNGDRYDQSEYMGRLQTIWEIVDMRTLLVGDDELAKCQKLLADFAAEGKLPAGATDEDMWYAKKTVAAIMHEPTGEKMLAAGRMSAFVPMNVPVTAGMIMAKAPMWSVFWQWCNQSYNVLNNYSNRAGADIDMTELMKSYGAAVGIACSIALGSGVMMKKFPAMQKLGPLVPYLAVASAGSFNVVCTRMDEITNGITVASEAGKSLGVSILAGQQAVFQTVTSRSCFLPIFLLLVPPAIMGAAKSIVPKGPAGVVFELVVIAGCITFALPMALAVQPQRMTLDVSALEAEFHNLLDDDGKKVTHVYANKGL